MCRFKNKKGFSLIELMVVVAIMGILASIGIPQYLRYRDTTAWGRLDNEILSVHRSFTNCIASMTFQQCDSAGELGLDNYENISDVETNDPTNTLFCLDIERNIGAFMAEACIGVNALTLGRTITNNRSACVTDGGTSLWDSVMSQWDTSGGMIAGEDAVVSGTNCSGTMNRYACTAAWDMGCAAKCGDIKSNHIECTGNAVCTGQGLDYCAPADDGQCMTGGVCS